MTQPNEELITPENLSKELLKSILDAAYMDTSLDNDGDLIVRESINCWIIPNAERKDKIELLSMFGFEPSSPRLQRLEFVNKVNSEFAFVKAIVQSEETLHFQYDIMIAGGITKKAFVLAVKRFCSIPRSAAAEHGDGIVA